MDQAIPSNLHLRINIWVGLLDLGVIGRELNETGWHVNFVTPQIILLNIVSEWRLLKEKRMDSVLNAHIPVMQGIVIFS